jgi:hypothetical protein
MIYLLMILLIPLDRSGTWQFGGELVYGGSLHPLYNEIGQVHGDLGELVYDLHAPESSA